jgi:hypothetical protein
MMVTTADEVMTDDKAAVTAKAVVLCPMPLWSSRSLTRSAISSLSIFAVDVLVALTQVYFNV